MHHIPQGTTETVALEQFDPALDAALRRVRPGTYRIRVIHGHHGGAALREQVRRELEDGTYKLDIDVDIAMMVDFKAIYKVGQGHLTHDREGFTLTGCGGKLRYTQKPTASYGLYADYYWYEIADTICIGDNRCLYYCFPKAGYPVAKTRLAAEELYKLCKTRALAK